MAISPPYLALRGFTDHPELNSSKPLVWLVQFLILIISLAEYFQFRRFFGTAAVQFPLYFTSCEKSFTNCNIATEAQKNVKPVALLSFGLIYMPGGLNGIHLW
jgi:hypothetical protein